MSKAGIGRTVRNIVITAGILLVVLVAGGVAYVFYSGRNVPEQKVPKIDVSNLPAPLPKPTPPSPNASPGVAVEVLTSPVARGSNASITIRSLATSRCIIEVSYNDVPVKDSGLAPKIADDYGTATWSWTVDKTAPIGNWPVKVTCTYNGKSGLVIGKLQVAKN